VPLGLLPPPELHAVASDNAAPATSTILTQDRRITVPLLSTLVQEHSVWANPEILPDCDQARTLADKATCPLLVVLLPVI
jgi:hypothetical protein